MLIPLQKVLKNHNISIKGVVHVGGHYAEELLDYSRCGAKFMCFIEASKKSYDEMVKRVEPFRDNNNLHVQLINVACGHQEGRFIMNSSPNNEGQSNSLLKPKLHLEQHKEIVFTETEEVDVKQLDNLDIQHLEMYDMLAMDVQGFEGEVLKGATKLLEQVKVIYTEINRDFTYDQNMLVNEMDDFLVKYGFIRIETMWPSPNLTWGDAIYLKNSNGIQR